VTVVSDPSQEPEHRPEPDYRFSLANERTFLAWIRTALALLAGAVAVVTLLPEFGFPGARHIVSAVLALAGTAVALASMRRWRLAEQAIRANLPLPGSKLPSILAVGIAVLTLAMVTILLLTPTG
jgi:putative membrane protein